MATAARFIIKASPQQDYLFIVVHKMFLMGFHIHFRSKSEQRINYINPDANSEIEEQVKTMTRVRILA